MVVVFVVGLEFEIDVEPCCRPRELGWLEFGRGGLKAIRASLKRISGRRCMQRRGGLLLKPAV